jgi:hypothetical protein
VAFAAVDDFLTTHQVEQQLAQQSVAQINAVASHFLSQLAWNRRKLRN